MATLLEQLKTDIRFIEGLKACINCGTCTAICPAAQFYDYDPRQIADTMQKGNEAEIENLLKSDTIWFCGECLSCKTRCPRGNTPGYIIQSLRNLAQNNGFSSGGVAARIIVTDGVFFSNLYTDINYMLEGVAPINDNIAWLVGFKTFTASSSLPKGVIYFTNDGGLNWQLQTMPANALDVNLWKVSFVGARR